VEQDERLEARSEAAGSKGGLVASCAAADVTLESPGYSKGPICSRTGLATNSQFCDP